MGVDLFAAAGSRVVPSEPWADSIDDAALLVVVQRAILDLPDSQRQVVTLRDVQGLSAQEVCEALSISAANQRVLLHRGRARVRANLSPALTRRRCVPLVQRRDHDGERDDQRPAAE